MVVGLILDDFLDFAGFAGFSKTKKWQNEWNLKLEFPKLWGSLGKNPFFEDMDTFWNYILYHVIDLTQ